MHSGAPNTRLHTYCFFEPGMQKIVKTSKSEGGGVQGPSPSPHLQAANNVHLHARLYGNTMVRSSSEKILQDANCR